MWEEDKMRNILITLTLAAILFPLAVSGGKFAERKYFPVVENFKITDSSPFDEDKTLFNVTFDKLRNCEFLGVNWNSSNGNRLPFEFREDLGNEFVGGVTRPTGSHTAGPWLVWADNLDTISGTTYHKCHPLWITETLMYTGKSISINTSK